MSKQPFRERWVREVFRTPLITDSVRVSLLAMAAEMDEDGVVAMKRGNLAEMIGRHSRKVDERIKGAVGAGFLERVARGQKHRAAVYRATLPERLSAPDGGRAEKTLSAPDGGRAEAFSARRFLGVENPGPDNLSAPDGGRAENPAHSKDRARAHSKTADRSSTTVQAEDDDSRPGGVVVKLFDDEIEEQRKQTSAKRGQLEHQPTGARVRPREEPDRFAEFWAAYPRKVAKGAARKAWAKAIKDGADPGHIISGARRYATDPRRQTADIRYTAHASTWLNQERWADEDEPAPLTLDGRQQATDDWMNRALARARARDAQENR